MNCASLIVSTQTKVCATSGCVWGGLFSRQRASSRLLSIEIKSRPEGGCRLIARPTFSPRLFRLWSSVAVSMLLSCVAAVPQQQKSRDLKYEEDRPAQAPVTVPRGYALMVGIAKYKNLPAKSQLEFSERDAESIYSILISPEGGNFRAENVHRLIGAKATLANLKQELEVWLPSVAKEDDRVVIYFAGHGFHLRRARLSGSLRYRSREHSGAPAIRWTRWAQVAGSRIKAKWKVLLTDACHCGAISPDAELAQVLNKSLLDLSRSMFSLTASRDRERSFESKDWGGGHGIFTYYVVKGLEGEADESGDGIVTADELAELRAPQCPRSDQGPAESDVRPRQLRSQHAAGVSAQRTAGRRTSLRPKTAR